MKIKMFPSVLSFIHEFDLQTMEKNEANRRF